MTPWVKRLIIANVIVFFLEQTVARADSPSLEFVPRYVLVPAVDDRDVHVPPRPERDHAHPVQHARPVLLRPAGRGAARVEAVHHALLGQRHLRRALFSFIFAPLASVIGASAAVFGVMLALRALLARRADPVLLLPADAGALRRHAHGGDGAVERLRRLARRRGGLRAPRRVRRRLALPRLGRARAGHRRNSARRRRARRQGHAARTRSGSTRRRSTR